MHFLKRELCKIIQNRGNFPLDHAFDGGGIISALEQDQVIIEKGMTKNPL